VVHFAPTHRLRGLLPALALLGLAGCRDADQLNAEFESTVEDNARCSTAGECTVVFTECPLGCYHAVRTDRAEQVQERADALVAEYELWGQACAYDCTAAGAVSCQGGLCHVEPQGFEGDAGVEDGG